MKNLTFILIGLIAFKAHGQSVSLSGGNFTITKNASHIVDAGLDYSQNVEESSSMVNLLSATGNGATDWKVSINKSDIHWIASLVLEIKRVNDGTGGSILGSSPITLNTYQNLNITPLHFVNGNGIVNNIHFQYKISGISVLIPSDIYTTNIIYTIADL